MNAPESTFNDAELTLALERSRVDDVALQMDEEAFRGFYERTSRMLWAYLQRMTGDRQAADDLLQDTYYRFLRAGAVLDTEAHRRHYLFRIATNLARDTHRRHRGRPAHVVHDERQPVAADTPLHGTQTEHRLDLNRAMSRMPERERAMLWLAYAQGASHKEIAEVVGVGASSVKTLLFRARRRLADLLSGGKEAR